MTIGFIGSGNMAAAIVQGITDAALYAGEDVYLSDTRAESAEALAGRTGAQVAADSADLIAHSQIVVLAVKPQVLPGVLSELRAAFESARPLVVSIAAGLTLETLGSLLPEGLPIVRVMPNVNAQIGAGVAAVAGNAHATEADVARVREVFAAVGVAIELAEKDFAAYTAVAGSSPAFTFAFIDALARGAVKNGLPKQLAVRVAAQAVAGSAQLVLARLGEQSPADLVDIVSSPGGTTVAGTVAMEDAGFSAAVVRGVQATVDRDRELGS